MREIEACLVCGGETITVLYESTFEGTWEAAVPLFLTDREKAVHGTIGRCHDCGFIFTNRQFTTEEYAKIYDAISSEELDQGRERSQQCRINNRRRMVGQYVSGGRFLDLGCGAGYFHRAMDGYEGVGFEIRPGKGYEFRTEDRLYTGSFIDFSDDPENAGKFDFVTSWDVLEHLTELDACMEAINRILTPDGLFFCTVPNASSMAARLSGRRWNCILLEHLWYFSQKTLTRYLRRFGFEIINIGTLGFPVEMQTVALRFAQTYNGSAIRLPKFIANRVVSLPIGLMYAVSRSTVRMVRE